MARRLVNARKHRRLFAKWRRVVLRRFLVRSLGCRRRRFVRLDSRAVFSLTRRFPITTIPTTFARARRAVGARVFRWFRGRQRYQRSSKNRSRLRVYSSTPGAVRGLRNSWRLFTIANGHSAGRSRALIMQAAALLSARRLTGPNISSVAPILVSRRAGLVTMRRSRQQLEKRTYRHQLKVRLPCTTVKRRGLRQAGRTLFARNTLPSPTNWLGVRKRLLAPGAVWVLRARGKRVVAPLLASDMRHLEALDSTLPRT